MNLNPDNSKALAKNDQQPSCGRPSEDSRDQRQDAVGIERTFTRIARKIDSPVEPLSQEIFAYEQPISPRTRKQKVGTYDALQAGPTERHETRSTDQMS